MFNHNLSQEYTDLGNDIIGASFEVRRISGRGLKEKFYEAALVWELRRRGHDVKRQVSVDAVYKGEIIDDSFVADIIVDNKVIIETKALKYFTEAEVRQLYTYLKLTGCSLGYLINFGAEDFRIGNLKKEEHPYVNGIYRILNTT